MRYILTSLFFFIGFSVWSQVIEVTYQEELEFAYLDNESLIKQWKEDRVIWSEWSYGYEIGKGGIRYTFDFYGMKVTREEDNGEGFKFVDEWDIIYVLSPWDGEHFSCVAITPIGEYFYEINSFVDGGRCLLMSYKNIYKNDVKNIPSLDWDLYNIGCVSTNYGDFVIKVNP
jgi:hypothetical protein